jgi:transcriptional regulator with XRE-family HTH domain
VIAAVLVREIRSMLAEGRLSQRRIAERMGVSRGTVNAIARGKRPDYTPVRRAADTNFVPPSGPPTRCPGCGGLVRMPCLACYVRAIRQRCRLREHSVV